MSNSSGFDQLKAFSKQLKAQAKAQEHERAQALVQKSQQRHAAEDFASAMAALGGVQKLQTHQDRVIHKRQTSIKPIQPNLDEKPSTSNPLSDVHDTLDFIESEDGLRWRRHDVTDDLSAKLYRGYWTVQTHIDLHGLFVDEARDLVFNFIKDAHRRGYRCLRIVTGVGYGSEKGTKGVLKEKVRLWLKQCPQVMCFAQAPDHLGGEGAWIVLLEGA